MKKAVCDGQRPGHQLLDWIMEPLLESGMGRDGMDPAHVRVAGSGRGLSLLLRVVRGRVSSQLYL